MNTILSLHPQAIRSEMATEYTDDNEEGEQVILTRKKRFGCIYICQCLDLTTCAQHSQAQCSDLLQKGKLI